MRQRGGRIHAHGGRQGRRGEHGTGRQRHPWPAVLVAAVAALVVSPLVVSPLVAPAWAERFTGQPQASTPPAGTVDTVSVAGPARLDTPSTITASAAVTVPGRTRGDVVLTVSGRTCTAGRSLPLGRSTLTVSCPVTPRANQVPSLPATVEVRLERVVNGQRASTRRTVERSVAMDDGDPVPYADAARRWRTLTAALHAEAGGMVVAAEAGNQASRGAGADDPANTVARRRTQAAATSLYSSADLASRVWSEAQRSGWASTATRGLVRDLLATRKPDGGYGLAAPWDAYGDGTVNPESTTYTVTTAGHVGWVLLEAHRHGALPPDGLSSAVDALLAVPRLDGGTCLAYSNSVADRTEPCVYNVNVGAAAFLVQVRRLTDHRAAEIDALLDAVRSGLTRGYDWATGYWVYMAGQSVAQDISHQIYTAKSVDVVDPDFRAVDRMMALPWWRHPRGMTQSASALASAMMDVAKDCRHARSPAVLVAAERALGTDAPAFTVMGMAAVGDEIVRRCFG